MQMEQRFRPRPERVRIPPFHNPCRTSITKLSLVNRSTIIRARNLRPPSDGLPQRTSSLICLRCPISFPKVFYPAHSSSARLTAYFHKDHASINLYVFNTKHSNMMFTECEGRIREISILFSVYHGKESTSVKKAHPKRAQGWAICTMPRRNIKSVT